ncbi:DNA polymerase III subunit psi [Vibrio gazogenes]|uniref:DNA polymerase III subunit psi n=1 Tax=Vibrio gazogenes DSM 21264 = NBRC 103151 TaxID=1123492 RepID=A0A1M5E9Z1_VIBGA|nr:DNA polymerase III subunit psi [Vibrio gazogenes]USP14288.1 DNA polymerase III subunit psi [Vibrio gazogenes]SHF76000.1 DNA polymerase III, psi subunit [Vibrio gazogenes DSM 21264] [Vibrio gazogenes DSM 21264 = NBRC 103151]SJN58788.1 DNA polymerase III subunit psi [Vibrio gazogenes]
MQERQRYYLQEMGIQSWQLIHPERMQGIVHTQYELPSSCKLLFVSPVLPEGPQAVMFEKVLKSFDVSLEEARHVDPHSLDLVAQTDIEWIWFAGCSAPEGITAKLLTSPLLSQIDGHPQHRRELWRQICSYRAS